MPSDKSMDDDLSGEEGVNCVRRRWGTFGASRISNSGHAPTTPGTRASETARKYAASTAGRSFRCEVSDGDS